MIARRMLAALAMLALLAPAAPQAQAEGAARTATAAPETPYRWFDPVIDLRALLMQGFVDVPDERAMQRAVLDAMVRALRDPYTVYVPPDDEGDFNKAISGAYVGIGVELDLEDGRPVVITPMDDSPALEAGVLPGDVILSVDGTSTQGAGAAHLEELLPGEPGSTVRLRLRRPDGTEREVTVARRHVETRTVKGVARTPDGWRWSLDPDRRIAYVRITQFTERTASELDAALAKIRADGVSGLVLDLRGNGGGSLEAAVAVADRFMPAGAIVSLRGRGDKGRTWDAGASPEDVLVPMVVLVNEGSASASEVVAGALQEGRHARVVGTRSYGKGSVQEVRALPDGMGTLKLTTARYQLPSGRNVGRLPGATRWGVEPESGFHVPMTEADQLANADARRGWEAIAPGAPGPSSQATQTRAQDAGTGAAQLAPAPTPQPDWQAPGSIRTRAHDPQLAAALEAMQGFLDAGQWPVVGDLSGDVGAGNDELRASLEYRRRLLEELQKTDQSISTLRGTGAGVDDPMLRDDAPLIDGEIVLRNREGRVVGRWILKDPGALRRGLREGAEPAPEYTPARDPEK